MWNATPWTARVEVPLPTKLPTFWMERMEPGEVVPIPKKPRAVKRAASVREPDLKVAKARSPCAVEVAPLLAPPWKILKTEAVVVPTLCVASSVLKARETFVEEVAEP